MTFMKSAAAAAACFAALAVSGAEAAPVTYTLTTLDASGTLDGVVFGAFDVTFTLKGDTDDLVGVPGSEAIRTLDAMVEINTGTTTTVQVLSPDIGLYNAPGLFGMWRFGSLNLLDSTSATIDLGVSSPAIPVVYEYLQWSTGTPIETDGGTLVFDDAIRVSGTYAAVVEPTNVPLPAAGWLLIAGLGGVAALRRRAG